jgi:hypothetical protein
MVSGPEEQQQTRQVKISQDKREKDRKRTYRDYTNRYLPVIRWCGLGAIQAETHC